MNLEEINNLNLNLNSQNSSCRPPPPNHKLWMLPYGTIVMEETTKLHNDMNLLLVGVRHKL